MSLPIELILLVLLLSSFRAWGGALRSRIKPDDAPPRTHLVWISVDGFRHDYVGRAETPTLDRLMSEGAFTYALEPTFPSLTFPGHVSQSTGTTVSEHGIPMNNFYDTEWNRSYSFPPFSSMLGAEPIWITAQRQGVRTAVHDWPLSHMQRGEVRTEYYGDRYDGQLTDEDRLNRLLDTWRRDRKKPSLQLLMGYGDSLDKIGHQAGPDSPEVDEAVAQLDERLGRFLKELLAVYHRKARPQDSLYLFVTTDHGMSTVQTNVHIERLLELDERSDVLTLTAGNIAMIYLHQIEAEDERKTLAEQIRTRLNEYEFMDAYLQSELPERWGFAHPTRGGDVVAVLHSGYTFNRRISDSIASVAESGGSLGMHGYDPKTDPDVLGFAVFWRYPEPLGGRDLGPVHSLQLHATAAAVLGIEPSSKAHPHPVLLKPPSGE